MAKQKRCHANWPGECPPKTGAVNLGHHCARPASHPDGCMCYCGARPPTPAADQPDQLALLGRQQHLPFNWMTDV